MTLDEMIAYLRANLEPWPEPEPDVIVVRPDGSMLNETALARFVAGLGAA